MTILNLAINSNMYEINFQHEFKFLIEHLLIKVKIMTYRYYYHASEHHLLNNARSI